MERYYMSMFLRFLLIFTLPLVIVVLVSKILEFNYQIDITYLEGTSINNESVDIDLNNKYFKHLTKIESPVMYDVFIFNDVFVYLEASNPTSTPSKTIAIFNDKVEAHYQQLVGLSTKPTQFKDQDDLEDYVLKYNIKLKFDYIASNKLIRLDPNDYLRLKIDKEHKNIIFYFKLNVISKFIIYFTTMLALYPLFLTLAGLIRFIMKGEPFIDIGFTKDPRQFCHRRHKCLRK